jgi:hypothetical protein
MSCKWNSNHHFKATLLATLLAGSAGAIAAPPVTNGLVLSLEANTITDAPGTPVTTWSDQSGLGNHLIASGSPTLVNSANLNVRAVAFSGGQDIDGDGFPDGVGDMMERLTATTGLPTGNTDRTVFLMANYDGKLGGFGFGNDKENQAFSTVTDGRGNLSVRGWIDENDFPATERGRYAGWLVQSAVLKAGELRHYKDGRLIGVATHTYDTARDAMMARLGVDLAGNRFVEMETAAVLVYNRALDDQERIDVEYYLQNANLGFLISPKVWIAKASLLGPDKPLFGPTISMNYRLSGKGYDAVLVEIDTSPVQQQLMVKDGNGILPNDVVFDNVDDGQYTVTATLLDAGGTPLANPEARTSLNITVSSSNLPPVAKDDAGSAYTGEEANIDLIANDVDKDGTINPATIAIVNAPASGNVRVNSDGTVNYKSDAGFLGTDSFSYTVEDDQGFASNEATVTMTVTTAGSVGGGGNTANESTGASASASGGGGAFNPLFLSLFALAGLIRGHSRKSA